MEPSSPPSPLPEPLDVKVIPHTIRPVRIHSKKNVEMPCEIWCTCGHCLAPQMHIQNFSRSAEKYSEQGEKHLVVWIREVEKAINNGQLQIRDPKGYQVDIYHGLYREISCGSCSKMVGKHFEHIMNATEGKPVSDLACLDVYSGDEPARLVVRRLWPDQTDDEVLGILGLLRYESPKADEKNTVVEDKAIQYYGDDKIGIGLELARSTYQAVLYHDKLQAMVVLWEKVKCIPEIAGGESDGYLSMVRYTADFIYNVKVLQCDKKKRQEFVKELYAGVEQHLKGHVGEGEPHVHDEDDTDARRSFDNMARMCATFYIMLCLDPGEMEAWWKEMRDQTPKLKWLDGGMVVAMAEKMDGDWSTKMLFCEEHLKELPLKSVRQVCTCLCQETESFDDAMKFVDWIRSSDMVNAEQSSLSTFHVHSLFFRNIIRVKMDDRNDCFKKLAEEWKQLRESLGEIVDPTAKLVSMMFESVLIERQMPWTDINIDVVLNAAGEHRDRDHARIVSWVCDAYSLLLSLVLKEEPSDDESKEAWKWFEDNISIFDGQYSVKKDSHGWKLDLHTEDRRIPNDAVAPIWLTLRSLKKLKDSGVSDNCVRIIVGKGTHQRRAKSKSLTLRAVMCELLRVDDKGWATVPVELKDLDKLGMSDAFRAVGSRYQDGRGRRH